MTDEYFRIPFPPQLLLLLNPAERDAFLAVWQYLSDDQRQYFADQNASIELKHELKQFVLQKIVEGRPVQNAEVERLAIELTALQDVTLEQLKTAFALSAWCVNTHGLHIESYLFVLDTGQCVRMAARLFGTYVQWVAVLATSINAREGIELRVPETNLPFSDWKDLPIDEVGTVNFQVSDDDTAVILTDQQTAL